MTGEDEAIQSARGTPDDLSADYATVTWPDPAEWSTLHQQSLEARYRRVLAEAIRYRDTRDEHWARLVDLQDRTAQLSHQVQRLKKARLADSRAAKRELKKSRRQLAKARARLRRLERTKAVRLTRFVASLRSRVVSRVRAFTPTKKSSSPEELESGPDLPVSARVRKVAATSAPVPTVTTYEETRELVPEVLHDRTARAERGGERLKGATVDSTGTLRVAAIVDDFTAQSLSLECDLRHLHPDTWRIEMDGHQPDILFVESAWRGDSGTWHNTVPGLPDSLTAILEYCHSRDIPTIFWNKEDPVHFQTFLRVAAEFDHVFTTDIDCLPRYRDALGHDRVHFLPFACQPRLQNPIEHRQRVDALAFAGGYYTRYPERMRDLAALLTGAAETMPVHIWDREFGTTLEAYRFPAEYEKYIVGTLSPSDIEVAYKGYRFALNLNSVKNSQSMFARRAYELLSSGTVTVSNYSRGMHVMLGDLIPMSDSKRGVKQTLERLRGDRVAYDRLRLQGLRKVHAEHTYADRLRYVLSCITGEPYTLRERHVAVVALVATVAEAQALVRTLRTQRGVKVSATFVTETDEVRKVADANGIAVVAAGDIAGLSADALLGDADGLALLNPADWYGATYLQDLALAWGYCDADVIGRAAFAELVDSTIVHRNPGVAYQACSRLEARAALIRASACSKVRTADLLAGHADSLNELTQFTIDRFDYCRNGAHAEADRLAPWSSDDGTDSGISTSDLFAGLPDGLKSIESRRQVPVLDRSVLAAIPTTPELRVTDVRLGVRFQSTEHRDLPDYRWLEPSLPVVNGQDYLRLHLDYDGDLNLMLAGRFFDANGATLTSFTGRANQNLEIVVPDGAATVALAIRAQGVGTSVVRSLFLDAVPLDPPVLPTGNEVLIVTDQYPAYDDLYRNAFLHTRVRGYRNSGLSVDLFRLRPGERLGYHEFESVEIATGSREALCRALQTGAYRAIFVHFLDEALWEVLRPFSESHQIIVWVHGQDIQPSWRREFGDTTTKDAEIRSARRTAFWRDLATSSQNEVTFIFVSQGFADEVRDDLGKAFRPSSVRVIHNPIDTELFDYVPKGIEQRKKILSVRSFVSPKYANDLSVAAVLRLADEPWFEDLEFCFIGEGPLFYPTLEALRGFPNVTIRNEFLTHSELACLQREFGVFLTPSRWDSQGVSRDEAMSSGLVPITHAVGAIAEFVSNVEGYVLPAGDIAGIGEAIREMYVHPEIFLAKSHSSAKRVRAQSSLDVVCAEEIALLNNHR